MDDGGIPRRVWASKGLFVAVGLAYVAWGPPVLGLDPGFVGGALVAYGVVSFVGGRLVHRWGFSER